MLSGWKSEVRERKFFWEGSEETSPLPPSKGEMRRASIHEQYDVETGDRLGKARKAERTGTSGTGETGGTGGTSGTGGNKKKAAFSKAA